MHPAHLPNLLAWAYRRIPGTKKGCSQEGRTGKWGFKYSRHGQAYVGTCMDGAQEKDQKPIPLHMATEYMINVMLKKKS